MEEEEKFSLTKSLSLFPPLFVSNPSSASRLVDLNLGACL